MNVSSTTHLTDEERKAQAENPTEKEQRNLSHMERFYSLKKAESMIEEFMSKGMIDPGLPSELANIDYSSVLQDAAVIVPTYEPQLEKKKAVLATARYLIDLFGKDSVVYIIAGLHEETLAELQKMDVLLIDEDKIREEINWAGLSEITHSELEPETLKKKLRGKGETIYCGLLYLVKYFPAFFEKFEWVMFCDSEISSIEEYDPVRHLFYPVATGQAEGVQQLQLAKIGRGNEPLMQALGMLEPLMYSSAFNGKGTHVSSASQHIRNALMCIAWMGCGERALRTDVLLNMPWGGGYLVEIAATLRTPRHFHEKSPALLQTWNTQPRIDGSNSPQKEHIMWDHIAKFAFVLATMGVTLKNVRGVKEISSINKALAPLGMAFMHPTEFGIPMQAVQTRFPRLYPPIALAHECEIIRTAG